MYKKTAIATGVLAMAAASASWAAQGVSDTEIVLGLNTDLSGPVANYGKESRNGMNMAVEQINERGGIHGRKIRLVVEDHAYDPRKAIMAAQKLVHQDQVFAVLGTLGTATSMASLPILVDSKVFSFMPQGASKGLYDPPSPYKVALSPS
nr:ABC transporter substrate-binding protein [Pseudomonas sp.]